LNKRIKHIIILVHGILIFSVLSASASDFSHPASALLTLRIPLFQYIFHLVFFSSVSLGILILILLSVSLFLFFKLKKYRNENAEMKLKIQDKETFSDSNLLYNLTEYLPDFIYVKDENSRYVFANNKFGRFVGQPSGHNLIGKTDHDFYPKHVADEHRKNEIEVMVNDSPILSKTEKTTDEHGKEIYLSTSKIPLHDQKGRVTGIVGIVTDITEIVITNEKLEQKNKDLQEINKLLMEKKEENLQQEEELKIYYEKSVDEKNQLRTLIDNMPDRIYIKDRRSRFVAGNIHLAKILKVKSPDELIGKTDYDFHPKNIAEEFYNDEQKIMSTGIALINKEEKGIDIEGKEAIISTTKVPVRDEYGNVVGIVGVGREITAYKESEIKLIEQQDNLREANVLLREKQDEIQKKSEELYSRTQELLRLNHELEKLSLVASSTDNVIIIMDADANFEWVNHSFEKHYGMSFEEYLKTKGRNLRENSFNKNINEILDEVIKTCKPKIYTSKGIDNNNKIIWLQTTLSPVLNDKGEITRLIAIDSDITQLMEAEDKISQQKTEIEKQRDELRKLNATKDKFFSIIAHDLRNPFHSIMGFSDLLMSNYDSTKDNDKKEFIRLINESANSAYGLLENLLNWTRAQTNRIKFEPSQIDLSKIIHRNISILSVHAKNKDITLTYEVPQNIIVVADENMVDTIIRNLLANAIKFTQTNGKVHVSARIEDYDVIISVADTGIGMDEETLSKLLNREEFFNTPGTSGETGTGLGLIVSKEFITRHGSDLIIESKKNEGSIFTFSLPIKEKK